MSQLPKILNASTINVSHLLLAVIIVGWLLIIGRDILIPLILALILWDLLNTIARFLQSPIGSFSVPYPIALVGALARVETVKAGAYWIIWSHFFEKTDINRVSPAHTTNGTD